MEWTAKDHASLRRLTTEGVACLSLSPNQQDVSRALFRSFAAALPALRGGGSDGAAPPDLAIPEGSIDAHRVTGYHPAGELPWSYSSNLHREGLVWSRQGDAGGGRGCGSGSSWTTSSSPIIATPEGNEQQDLSDHDKDEFAHFLYRAGRMEHMLHDMAVSVLEWIESYLELSPGWFRGNVLGNPNSESGPVKRDPCYRYHHPWHLKNYVFDDPPLSESSNQPSSPPRPQWDVVLPVHTDPSLVSVVVLDRPGTQPGGQGLQCWDRDASQWREVEASGHGVAVVLIGSVLSRITEGHLYAPKHRVVTPIAFVHHTTNTQPPPPAPRRAATLFLRPAPEALLQVPPSPRLRALVDAPGQPSGREERDPVLTYGEWTSRVSKNYRRQRLRTPRDN